MDKERFPATICENLLYTASEECGEIVQDISKALRFGLNSRNPENPERTNGENVLIEFYQLSAVVRALQQCGALPVFDDNHVESIQQEKMKKMKRWQDESVKAGLLKI